MTNRTTIETFFQGLVIAGVVVLARPPVALAIGVAAIVPPACNGRASGAAYGVDVGFTE
jgi:hypothetical protein